jgi:hypothetical protein
MNNPRRRSLRYSSAWLFATTKKIRTAAPAVEWWDFLRHELRRPISGGKKIGSLCQSEASLWARKFGRLSESPPHLSDAGVHALKIQISAVAKRPSNSSQENKKRDDFNEELDLIDARSGCSRMS